MKFNYFPFQKLIGLLVWWQRDIIKSEHYILNFFLKNGKIILLAPEVCSLNTIGLLNIKWALLTMVSVNTYMANEVMTWYPLKLHGINLYLKKKYKTQIKWHLREPKFATPNSVLNGIPKSNLSWPYRPPM